MGVRLQHFRLRRGFDCRVFRFLNTKRPKCRKRLRFRKFWRFPPNHVTRNALILHVKAVSGGQIFESEHSKKSQISGRTFKINNSASETSFWAILILPAVRMRGSKGKNSLVPPLNPFVPVHLTLTYTGVKSPKNLLSLKTTRVRTMKFNDFL